MDINTLRFAFPQIAGSDNGILTGVRPYREYVDGKATDKVLGYSYVVICPSNKYERIVIKVEQAAPVITPEELEQKKDCRIRPVNFEGRFYRDKNGVYAFSAKATAMEVLK